MEDATDCAGVRRSRTAPETVLPPPGQVQEGVVRASSVPWSSFRRAGLRDRDRPIDTKPPSHWEGGRDRLPNMVRRGATSI
jgi:hypothetical protein